MIDALTLDQLRVLVTVADCGSFSAAARRLRRVQSAISQSVRTLESTLSLRVFDRAGRYPSLTPAGAALVADARKLLRDAEAIKAKARAMTEGLEPELALAADPLFPNDVLMRGLRSIEERFSTLPIRLITAGVGMPERHLRDGTVTLAIYSLETTGAADLDATFLVDVDMIPVVAAEHPLATLPGPIGRAELSEHVQLVLTSMGSSGWSKGVVSPKVWRFADLHVRLEFLLAGFGWCNMPRHLVSSAIEEGRLVMLDLQEQSGFRQPLHAVHLQDPAPGPGAKALIETLQSLLKDAASDVTGKSA